MIPEERRDQWLSDLLAARKVSAEEGGFDRFLVLAEEAVGGGLFEAKGLLATITSRPEDNGEGEAVLSLLSGFKPEVDAQATIEELPRLLDQEEDEWAESMIETLARFNPDALIYAANEVSNPLLRSLLRVVLTRLSEEAQGRGANDAAGPLLLAIQ
jgi:hypothetical protein